MVNKKPNTARAVAQRSRVTELRDIFDAMADETLIGRLQAYRWTGRPGYPRRAMWRAYVASFYLNLPHTNALIRELQDDRVLREVCGFDADAPLPDRRTFNRFIRRVADHADLVEACLGDLTTQLKALLPDLGDVVAIDASTVRTHSNPRKGTDEEAGWGVSHSPQSRNKRSIEWVYGYKLHMVADANHGLPLALKVTKGNRSESRELPPLVAHAKGLHDWLAPRVAIADRGYDSATNHQALWFDHGILPIIHMRRPGGKAHSDLYRGIYTTEGVPICEGMRKMEYRGTDRQGRRVYRCPRDGCELADGPTGETKPCMAEYRQDPNEDIRLFGVIRKDSKRWKRYYAKRWAVERLFKGMKESRRLERHCLRGLRQVRLHALMSTLAYQATSLTHIRAGRTNRMRWMVRKVA